MADDNEYYGVDLDGPPSDLTPSERIMWYIDA